MGLWNFFERKDAKDLFLKFTPENSEWRVVSWNFDISSATERQWAIEIHHQDIELIQWERNKDDRISFFRNSLPLKKYKLNKEKESIKNLMNLAIHSTLKHSLEMNKDFMLTPVSGATAVDIQNENKALMWLEATLGTLNRALSNFKSRTDLILTASFFSGRVPETGENVLRLIAFNLDIFYYMRPDFTLLIVIFDDKDQGHGESKTPAFQQIIKVTKPQFYDEIMKIVNQLGQIGEIN